LGSVGTGQKQSTARTNLWLVESAATQKRKLRAVGAITDTTALKVGNTRARDNRADRQRYTEAVIVITIRQCSERGRRVDISGKRWICA